MFFDVLTYVLQGVRSRLLLAPVGRLRPLCATQAIYAGLFTSEIVPLRFGEVVRAFMVSRWLGSGIGVVVPSMIVERFLDAFWLVVGLGLAAMFVLLPKQVVNAGDLLGAVVLTATIVFVCVVLRKKPRARMRHQRAGSEIGWPDHMVIDCGSPGARAV